MSLRAQTYRGDLEVICVDACNQIPRHELTSLPRLVADKVQFLRPRATPWQRLGAFAAASARNTGLVYVGRDHDPREVTVLALDDCYELSPDCLERIAARAATGQYVVPRLGGGLDREQRFGAPWGRDSGSHPGGIVAYPLDKAIAINGYDERYDGCGAYEDVDFTARLEAAGVTWCRDDAAVATLHAPHRPRSPQPRCGFLAWELTRARREAGDLQANVPWTPAELAAFTTCGRELNPPKCWRTVHHGVVQYGGQCDYVENLNNDDPAGDAAAMALRVEPAQVVAIRTGYETQPWFDLAAARAAALGA